MRSASRDVEEPLKPTRRSARQASVESARDGIDFSAGEALRASRKLKEATAGESGAQTHHLELPVLTQLAPDLTIVEELHTQTTDEEAPKTQLQPSVEPTAPRRSLGAVSEMSGTTAISSFTFVEGEALNDRFILRHLPKLHDEAVELLNHLTPENSELPDLYGRIREMQIADSDFVSDYEDFDHHLSTRLAHYRGETQQYIHIRAVHAALFGENRDSAAAETGLDLLLYQANLAIFAKDMIKTHRNDKNMVDMLRVLDNLFPALFLPALVSGVDAAPSIAGDSALLQETFDLALELRTQLAIMHLLQGSASQAFNPVTALKGLFYDSNPDNPNEPASVRGWNVFALGGDDAALPTAFSEKVGIRVTTIIQYLVDDEALEERGNSGDMEWLRDFPWEATILRLLAWVRDRNTELEAAMRHFDGAVGISERVKAERQHPTAVAEADLPIQRRSPRKSRTSFGRTRRRSSKKFDPNAAIDTEVIKLIAIKRQADANPSEDASGQGQIEEPHAESHQAEDQAIEHEPMTGTFSRGNVAPRNQQEDAHIQMTEGSGEGERIDVVDDPIDASIDQRLGSSRAAMVVDAARPTPDMGFRPPSEAPGSTQLPPISAPSGSPQAPSSSRPPQSTNDFVNLLKARPRDKENHATSLFDRQANAQRFEFGDGFDASEPTPGPSTRQTAVSALNKGKEPLRASPRKRRLSEVIHDDYEEDNFDRAPRSANVERQRARAPKRVRTETYPTEPTSHQPRPQSSFRDIDEYLPPENNEPSEDEAPDMTEEAPPRSTYQDQVALARANTAMTATRRQRRAKKQWSVEEEDALIQYMAEYPRQYSNILKLDKAGNAVFFDDENGGLVERRTQVDLKDKARVMAKNMIK